MCHTPQRNSVPFTIGFPNIHSLVALEIGDRPPRYLYVFVKHILITIFLGTGSDCVMAGIPITNKLAIMMTGIRFIIT